MTQLSILIVDDNEADRFILNRLLIDTEKVAVIHEAANGIEATRLIRERPDVAGSDFIFLDLNMPLMNGYEFLDQYSELKTQFDLKSQIYVMTPFDKINKEISKALAHADVAGSMTKMPEKTDQLTRLLEAQQYPEELSRSG